MQHRETSFPELNVKDTKVCIIDDDELILDVLSRHLTKLGFPVQTFTVPSKALQKIEQEGTDIVICDINMPEMGGLEVLHKIKNAAPEAEVIMMSGRGTVDELTQAFRLGAIDYLKKPFSLAQVDMVLSRAATTHYLKRLNKQYQEELEKKVKILEELHQKERAMRKALEYLTQSVLKINKELWLSNQKLEESNRAIMLANQYKSEFLARVSHELRTPLNSILGFAEVLRDELFGPLNEKQKQYVENIWKSGKHLLDLINDILDISSIEDGALELNYEKVKVREVVEEAIYLVKEQAKKKNISIQIASSYDLSLEADPLRLRQILYNLLSNAVKFSHENSSVEVGWKEQEEHLLFWVRDWGIGIPEHMRERVFHKFHQGDSTLSRSYEGTGLGLALTKKLVQLHRGKIWFESEEGKGTTFYFTIPKKISVQASPHLEESSDDFIAPPEIGEDKKRIPPPPVVVTVREDEPDLDLIIRCLKDMGYDVRVEEQDKTCNQKH